MSLPLSWGWARRLPQISAWKSSSVSFKFLWSDENLQGKRIALQGLGAVGELLLEYLKEGRLEVCATNINNETLQRLQTKYGFKTVKPEAIDELQGYNPERVRMKTERIYGRLLHIFETAKREGILPLEAANRYAESRIREIHKMKRLYVPE